jgi:hypothetical protein
VPTYSGHGFCRVELLRFLHHVNKYKNVDVLVAWNGSGDPWGFEEFELQKIEDFEVEYNQEFGEAQSLLQGALVKKNNYFRKRVLEGDYTHLFLLESDVVPPSFALKQMLAWNKDAVSAPYFVKASQSLVREVDGDETIRQRLEGLGVQNVDTIYFSRESVVPSVWAYQRTSVGCADNPTLGHRIMTIEDWIDLRHKGHKLYPVASTGIGCMLLSRNLLEEVRFMGGPEYFEEFKGKINALSDYIFCENIKRAGFELFLDVDLLCQHYTVTSYTDQKAADDFANKFSFEK